MITREVEGGSPDTTIPSDIVKNPFRTFGDHGPLYKVLRVVDDSTVEIEVIESKEKLSYSLNRLAKDPVAS